MLTEAFSNVADTNNFVDEMTRLASQKFKACIPTFNVSGMGVVRGVPAALTDDEILENISVPIGCGKIIQVRCIKRKTIVNGTAELNNSETVILTFDEQVLLKRIYMCYTALSVDLYINRF